MILILSNLSAIGYEDHEIIGLIIHKFTNFVEEFDHITHFTEVLDVQCDTHYTSDSRINNVMITNLDAFIEEEEDIDLLVNYISGILPGIAYYSNISAYDQTYNKWFEDLDVANDLGHAEQDDLQDLIQGLLILCNVNAHVDPDLYTRLIVLLEPDDEYQPPINILLPSLLLFAKNRVSYTEHKQFYEAQYARIKQELKDFSVEELATIMYTIIISRDKDMRDNYINLACSILDRVSCAPNVISTARQVLSRMDSSEFGDNYNICRSNFMHFFNLLTHDNLPLFIQYFTDNKDAAYGRLNRIIADTLDVSVPNLKEREVIIPILFQLYKGDFLEKNFAITLVSFWREHMPNVFLDFLELETANTSNKETVELTADVFAPMLDNLDNLDNDSILSWTIYSNEKRSNVKYQLINNAKRKFDDSIADKDKILLSKIPHRTEDGDWYDEKKINDVLFRLFDGANTGIQVAPAISNRLLEHQLHLNTTYNIISDAISNDQESRILVPFAMDNNHWIGIVLNISPGVIKLEVLDSIRSNHYDEETQNKVKAFWTQFIGRSNADVSITHIKDVLFQHDSYNCGPCMIENIRHYLLGNEIVHDMSQARAMHTQMLLPPIQDPEEVSLSGEHQPSLEE